MKKILITNLFLFALIGKAQNWKNDDQYIQNFALYAVEEMEKYKIPASIKLAQGLLETGGGQSRLAREGNNHFGIKCKEEWTGKTMRHTDDAPNECFRVYNHPRESYEDHSKFLAYRKYYVNLFKLDMKDYKAWAHGLKKPGYATNPRYAYILIDKIEKLKLYEFDNLNSKEVNTALLKRYPNLYKNQEFMARMENEATTKPQNTAIVAIKARPQKSTIVSQKTKPEIIKSNTDLLNNLLVKNHPNGGRKFLVVPANTDLSLLSKKFNISENRLLKWNELNSTKLKKNDIIFLETKASQGNIATYKAKNGESMHEISQKFGIKLKKLYTKNRMIPGEKPRTGQVIYLQKKKPKNK